MPNASRASRLPAWLNRIWHLPELVSWMDPLPAPHRRGIITAVLVILLAFLWPSPSPEHSLPQQSSNAGTEVPLQAEIVDSFPGSLTPPPDTQGQWRDYTISSGKTLAQLFRDNNLPLNDVFSMAQAEGNDKPLSSLKAGQRVKIRQNAQGVVTGLTLNGTNGEILFTRQPNGSFIRVTR